MTFTPQKAKKEIEKYTGENWKRFVDEQEMGDCQWIVALVNHDFPNTKKVFGHVRADNGKLMAHHWIEVNGKIFEFSKGSLKEHILWDDLYSVRPEYLPKYVKSLRRR
jgi:hypothetical protein